MFNLDRAFRLQTRELLQKVGHFDANETIFLERELTQLRQKIFTVMFPESIARTLAPKATDIAPSAETYAFKVYRPVGQAEIIAYKSGELPRVDLVADEVLGKVRPLGAAYGWDINELREAARLQLQLSEVKARTAKEAIERGIDELLAFGTLTDAGGTNRPAIGLNGMVNNSLVISQGITAGTAWTSASDPADMLTDLNAMATSVSAASTNVFSTNAILLPLAYYNLANTMPWSALTGDSVLTVFKRNNPQIQSVTPWYKLDNVTTAQGGNNKPRGIAYQKDPMVAEIVIPQEYEQFPPEMRGLTFVVPCHARCGGTKVYQPLGMKYVDFG